MAELLGSIIETQYPFFKYLRDKQMAKHCKSCTCIPNLHPGDEVMHVISNKFGRVLDLGFAYGLHMQKVEKGLVPIIWDDGDMKWSYRCNLEKL